MYSSLSIIQQVEDDERQVDLLKSTLDSAAKQKRKAIALARESSANTFFICANNNW